MNAQSIRKHHIAWLAAALLVVAPLALPLTSAQGGLAGATSAASSARSVGTFDVTPSADGTDQASGSVVTSVVAETAASGSASGDGLIRDFSVLTSGATAAEIFSSIDVQGFSAVSALQGVGTTDLTLVGTGIVVTMTDNVNSLLTFQASGEAQQVITLNLGEGMTVSKSTSASTQNVWEVRSAADASGSAAIEGVLILVDAQSSNAASSGSTLAVQGESTAKATLTGGSQLIFRKHAEYGATAGATADASVRAAVRSYNQAVVNAIAAGRLAGEATTEFTAGATLIANAEFFSDLAAKTDAQVDARVRTTVRATAAFAAAAEASAEATAHADVGAVVAYDIDYVDLPAQHSGQVAAYVDGALAMRAASAAEVAANAAAGIESYWATTADGRVLVLASTSSVAKASTVTLAAIPDAFVAADTLAELDARLGVTTLVEGSYQSTGNLDSSVQGAGQVIGHFNSFFASEAKGSASVQQYTDVRSSTEIFASITFAAQAAADATAEVTTKASASASATARAAANAAASASGAVQVDTRVAGQLIASATFADNAFASIVAEAKAQTTAKFDLAQNVQASAVTNQVVALTSSTGATVGYLVIAEAEGQGAATGTFTSQAAGSVQAHLSQGEAVVFRGAGSAQAKAEAYIAAQAIAAGQLASEIDVGLVANAIASTAVDYTTSASATVVAEATARGKVALDVTSRLESATAIAVKADRATLPAIRADDILVDVDGEAATRVATQAQVLAAADAGLEAVYSVQTTLDGQTQVLVAVPDIVASAATRVDITSKLDAEARLKAALDVFGSFVAGYGGAATGSIVSLIAKADAGLILDYTVNARATAAATAGATTKVFDTVQVGSSAFASASAAASNSIRFTSEDAVIEAYDISSALMKVTATADTAASFDLAENIDVTAVSDTVLMLSATDFAGALILVDADGTVATTSSLVVETTTTASAAAQASTTVQAHLEAGAQVIFKAFSGFEAELTSAEQKAQAEAIASGDLLGHVIVDTDAFTGATTTAAVNYYSNVQATTSVASADKIEILVDSATHVGKSIIISLDRDTVSGLINGDAKLLVDGKSVARADSYEDALVPDADKYWLITTEGEAGLQAIVTLSHFSTRTITLETPPPPSIFLWTTIGLGIVTGVQAIYPRLRRQW